MHSKLTLVGAGPGDSELITLKGIKALQSADVVLWSDNPLSVYAKAEKTFIDGICYYDLNKNQKLEAEVAAERARLTQKMNDAKTKGESTQKPARSFNTRYECETIGW